MKGQLASPRVSTSRLITRRYANTDYAFLSSLRDFLLRHLIISYDVACQWYKHLLERIPSFPKDLQLDLSNIVVNYLLPKWHALTHGDKCQSNFSFDRRRHMAQLNGEGVERLWSLINSVAFSSREMGGGSRCDIIDGKVAVYNWRMTTRFRKLRS